MRTLVKNEKLYELFTPSASITPTPSNIKIIQDYVPTTDHDDDEVETFFLTPNYKKSLTQWIRKIYLYKECGMQMLE